MGHVSAPQEQSFQFECLAAPTENKRVGIANLQLELWGGRCARQANFRMSVATQARQISKDHVN